MQRALFTIRQRAAPCPMTSRKREPAPGCCSMGIIELWQTDHHHGKIGLPSTRCAHPPPGMRPTIRLRMARPAVPATIPTPYLCLISSSLACIASLTIATTCGSLWTHDASQQMPSHAFPQSATVVSDAINFLKPRLAC